MLFSLFTVCQISESPSRALVYVCNASLEASSTQVRVVVCLFFGGEGWFVYYYLEESGIFLRLTAELAGNCALNVIFACVFVCV